MWELVETVSCLLPTWRWKVHIDRLSILYGPLYQGANSGKYLSLLTSVCVVVARAAVNCVVAHALLAVFWAAMSTKS